MGIILLYMVLSAFCTVSSGSLSSMLKSESMNDGDEIKLEILLTEISKDDNLCFHCIERRGELSRLRELLAKQQKSRERDQSLKSVRTTLNSLSIANSMIVFYVFGDPTSVSLVSLLSSLSMFGSIFVENVKEAILFESAVLLVSVVVIFKTCYAIIVRAIMLDRIKNR